MSEGRSENEILSREELAALLESVQESKRQEEARQTLRPAATDESLAARAELSRIAEDFAEEQGRSLSTLHQTPISFQPTSREEMALRDFGGMMLQTDRVARLELGPDDANAYLLLNRPFLFGWMVLAFGAQPGMGNELVPARSYSRIEERFIRRAASEIAQTLSKVLELAGPARAEVMALETPVSLIERGNAMHWVSSFDVMGLGELCCLRVALPRKLLGQTTNEAATPAGSRRLDIEGEILDVTTSLRVGIGFADATLSEVVSLAPGDEIELERLDPDALVVSVENKPKFRAERGTLDRRLAVRILEAL